MEKINYPSKQAAMQDGRLFRPNFCFVDLNGACKVPDKKPKPSKTIKTIKGFHLYFEDIPFSPSKNKELAAIYGGDDIYLGGGIFKEGTIICGHEYKAVEFVLEPKIILEPKESLIKTPPASVPGKLPFSSEDMKKIKESVSRKYVPHTMAQAVPDKETAFSDPFDGLDEYEKRRASFVAAFGKAAENRIAKGIAASVAEEEQQDEISRTRKLYWRACPLSASCGSPELGVLLASFEQTLGWDPERTEKEMRTAVEKGGKGMSLDLAEHRLGRKGGSMRKNKERLKAFTIKIPNDPFLIQCIRGKMAALGYWEHKAYNRLVERSGPEEAVAHFDGEWCLFSIPLTSKVPTITLRQFFRMKEPSK